MPYTFLFIMAAMASLVLVPFIFIGAFTVTYFVVPFLFKKPLDPSMKRVGIWKRIFLSLLCSVLSSILLPASILGLGALCVWVDTCDWNDYWRYNGALDGFRMPLEPPYELVMIDVLDSASIGVWQQDTGSLVWNITRYEKRGWLMFGETSDKYLAYERTDADRQWFIFDLTNGEKALFETEDEFTRALTNRGIQDIHLETVRENWNKYWAHPQYEPSEKPSPPLP